METDAIVTEEGHVVNMQCELMHMDINGLSVQLVKETDCLVIDVYPSPHSQESIGTLAINWTNREK